MGNPIEPNNSGQMKFLSFFLARQEFKGPIESQKEVKLRLRQW